MVYKFVATCLLIAGLGETKHLFPLLHLEGSNILEESVTSDETLSPYRLNYDTIRPNSYTLDITPYFESVNSNQEFTFTGKVIIDVTVYQADLRQIVLHSLVERISILQLTTAAGILINGVTYDLDNTYQFLIINLETPLEIDTNYVISIEYTGLINANPYTRGFYRASYFDENGNQVWYATTQFEPTHARKAFPCFDEPQFKAVFNLIINRPETFAPSFSNMPIESSVPYLSDRMSDKFYPTPMMPTYLLSFLVGHHVVARSSEDPNKLARIVTRPNAVDQADYALDVTIKLTDWLSEYLDFPYYDMAEKMKNDQVAITDFPSGAMENWGMVNYREAYLLFGETENTISEKENVASIAAHELGHKWFGNLVTCHWWSNIWLNEAFASHFENFATLFADPSFESEKTFFTYYQNSINADQVTTVTALHAPSVTTPSQISAHFGTITYAKGATFLRLLHNMLGDIPFRDSLRLYLKENAYSVGTPEYLYEAFEATVGTTFTQNYPNSDITTFMQGWVDQAGVPLLTVTVNSGSMAIQQDRYLISGQTSDTEIWHIPLTYSTRANINWNNVTPTQILTSKTTTIALTGVSSSDWIILNNQRSAYYRVNYDENNWKLIAEALRTDISSIHVFNRAQIVDDVFALMRSGQLSLELGFEILDFLADETEFNVWQRAINGFTWIRFRLLTQTDTFELYRTHLLKLMNKVINELGYTKRASDSAVTLKNRNQILSFACLLDHPECLTQAVIKYQGFMTGEIVEPDDRRYVFCYGLQQGSATEFQYLWNRFETSNNAAEIVSLLRSLSCTKDEASLKGFLAESTANPKIRLQDKSSILSSYIPSLNPTSGYMAFEFLRDNRAAVQNSYINSNFVSLMGTLIQYLRDEHQLQSINTWTYFNSILSDSENQYIRTVVASVDNYKNWGATNEETLNKILASVTLPEVTPEVTEPPVVTDPQVVTQEVTEPEVTVPEVTQPEVTEHQVTEPEITEPEVTEPEVTTPEVTTPEVTTPEVTTPEVTTPEVTTPEVISPTPSSSQALSVSAILVTTLCVLISNYC